MTKTKVVERLSKVSFVLMSPEKERKVRTIGQRVRCFVVLTKKKRGGGGRGGRNGIEKQIMTNINEMTMFSEQ